ncbi:MAG: hypothetical protein DRI69_08150 [Bacteroidetes bacterium]|nr:MAG: hypothetical protein DRI69_08150 [Bacteroidota bacterium]
MLRLIIIPTFLCSVHSESEHVNTDDPCAFLNNQLIQEFFEVDAGDINRESSESSNPSCTVGWVKPNIEELQKSHQQAMSQYMQDKMAGKDVKMPAYPGNNHVRLTIHSTVFNDKASAEHSFNTAMQRLQKGTTMEVNGKTETVFQYDTVPVENVADAAHWIEGLSQLSVQSGVRIFHLKVKVYDTAEENRETAEKIAQKLALTLN